MFIPGSTNVGADNLSRQGLRQGDLRLHPESVELTWKEFGQAEVDLFATHENSHCPLWFSLSHPAPLGIQDQLTTSSSVLAGPSMVFGFHGSSIRPSLANPDQEGPFFPGRGHNISPSAGAMEALGLALEGDQFLNTGLSTEIVETILNSRAPSTMKLYLLKWNVFNLWCRELQLDPVNCPVASVLEILQSRFSDGLSPSMLKVYVAAIAAFHTPLGVGTLVRHPLIVSFVELGGCGLSPSPEFPPGT